MSQTYLAYHFKVSPRDPGTDILIAQLGEIGFESFVETDEGVSAYIQQDDLDESKLNELQLFGSDLFSVQYTSEVIEQVNWNEEWERNFDPIEVTGSCVIRAPFHEPFGVPYEIIIEPKMSFGTGHHETTHMMLEFLLEFEMKGKTVLDMGCGTAVLAILSEMRGAAEIDAIDIDEWCVENSEENAVRNNCSNIRVQLGDACLLTSERNYNLIIANINRNILLNDIPTYVRCLEKGGTLLLSGFYSEDLKMISECCVNNGLQFVENKERNNWIAAKFVH